MENTRSKSKIGLWLTGLLVFILIGLGRGIEARAEKVEPGYSQYPIEVTSTSAVADDTIYTTSAWSGRVGLDGTHLGNPIPQGAYVVITVDSTYLDSFTVPDAHIVTGSRLDKTSTAGFWKMYVSLNKMDSATTTTFLYNS